MALLGLFSINTYALDLSMLKEKIRPHVISLLGEETTTNFLGKPSGDLMKSQLRLPRIPKVILDAKNEDFYNKKENRLSRQGEKYEKLSNDEKRSFRLSFLRQLYTVTRKSRVNDNDLASSLNVLEQGGNREGVYRSVTLDRTYSSLENYDEQSSDALVNFIQYFTPKYLNKKYQQTSLKSLNLWALKRLVTEKCLELIDALAVNPEDVYSWYAVYSAEIARNYPSLWQSKTRKKSSAEYHFAWAKNVPFQHIKSEVIIKNHKLMNYLQDLN